MNTNGRKGKMNVIFTNTQGINPHSHRSFNRAPTPIAIKTEFIIKSCTLKTETAVNKKIRPPIYICGSSWNGRV